MKIKSAKGKGFGSLIQHEHLNNKREESMKKQRPKLECHCKQWESLGTINPVNAILGNKYKNHITVKKYDKTTLIILSFIIADLAILIGGGFAVWWNLFRVVKG